MSDRRLVSWQFSAAVFFDVNHATNLIVSNQRLDLDNSDSIFSFDLSSQSSMSMRRNSSPFLFELTVAFGPIEHHIGRGHETGPLSKQFKGMVPMDGLAQDLTQRGSDLLWD